MVKKLENKTSKCPFNKNNKCSVYKGREYLHKKFYSDCQTDSEDFLQCSSYKQAKNKTMNLVAGMPFTIYKEGKKLLTLNNDFY